jgi:tetrahydromethanopterin S-methyltransferase subunit G
MILPSQFNTAMEQINDAFAKVNKRIDALEAKVNKPVDSKEKPSGDTKKGKGKG